MKKKIKLLKLLNNKILIKIDFKIPRKTAFLIIKNNNGIIFTADILTLEIITVRIKLLHAVNYILEGLHVPFVQSRCIIDCRLSVM